MITVGLVNELRYIVKSAGARTLNIVLQYEGMQYPLSVEIKDNVLTAHYNNLFIWQEKVEDADSMFGIESCHNIWLIIQLYDKNDPTWRSLCYFEKD